MLYLYCPYFHIFILLFPLLVCALTGLLLTNLDFFSIRAWGDWRPLFEGTQEDYQAWVRVSYLRIFAFCLIMMSRCQNCIFFYFCFVMIPILYPDKDYCRCMSFMWNEISGLSFVYVCENLAHLLQRKVFTEEIFLFVSICWPSSRTRTPYFGKRGVSLLQPNEIFLGKNWI